MGNKISTKSKILLSILGVLLLFFRTEARKTISDLSDNI